MNGIFGNLQKRVVERVERVPRVAERICVQCKAGRDTLPDGYTCGLLVLMTWTCGWRFKRVWWQRCTEYVECIVAKEGTVSGAKARKGLCVAPLWAVYGACLNIKTFM